MKSEELSSSEYCDSHNEINIRDNPWIKKEHIYAEDN